MKNNSKKKAIFPGTFEVFHDGHISILKKAIKIFDCVTVVVSNNENKISSPILDRFENAKKIISKLKIMNVEIIMNNGLTTDIATKLNIHYIIRGVRNDFDLNYEQNLFYSYKKLNKNIEMILFISSPKLKLSSSTLIKKGK